MAWTREESVANMYDSSYGSLEDIETITATWDSLTTAKWPANDGGWTKES